jgi:trehalose 6-phosphate phosphatase
VSQHASEHVAGAVPLIDPRTLAAAFADRCAPSGRTLIALDHDGTLSAIAASPDAATLAPGAAAAIAALCEHADVAVVSGRGLDDLTERFAGLPVTLVSEHGSRLRPPEGPTRELAAPIDEKIMAELRGRLHELLDARSGWLIEDKGVSLAVHHRLVADTMLEPTLSAVLRLFAAVARGSDGAAHVQPGHAVLELRPSGAGKGVALMRLADELAASPVMMVGDDLTDEPAFEVAQARGGLGVLVSAAPRASAASARLSDPSEVVTLLGTLAPLLQRG